VSSTNSNNEIRLNINLDLEFIVGEEDQVISDKISTAEEYSEFINKNKDSLRVSLLGNLVKMNPDSVKVISEIKGC